MHDIVIDDEGEDLHGSAATGTAVGIDLEDALEEFGRSPAARLQGGPVGQFRILVFFGEGTGLGEDAHSAPAGPAAYGVGAKAAYPHPGYCMGDGQLIINATGSPCTVAITPSTWSECDARVRAVGSCHREGQRHEITRVVREEIEQVGGSTLPLELCVLLV